MENLITFPGFGIELTLNPVVFTLFGHNFYWYGMIIAAGFLLAVFFCYYQAPQFGLVGDTLIDMLIFAVPISIVCARLYYIVFYLELYRTDEGGLDFGKMVRIWDGGLAIYGGIIGAILTLFVFCKIRKLSFGAFADLGCMGLLIGQCVGRWGNFINAEAYGGETTLPWRMGIYEGEQYLEVHPTFLYESLWNLLGFLLIVLILKNRRKFDGQLFLSYVAWYGLGRMFIEGMRTDSLYIPGTVIRVSQLLAGVTFAAALVLLAYVFIVKKPSKAGLYVNSACSEIHRKNVSSHESIQKEHEGDGQNGADHGREGISGENQNRDES